MFKNTSIETIIVEWHFDLCSTKFDVSYGWLIF